jgi:hypothetical protein
MGSETSFNVVDSGGGLGPLWRSLADLWFFGWLGNLWFSTLADTEAGRSQTCFDGTWIQMRGSALAHARYLRLYCVSRFKPFRQAYTFDLVSNEITRHSLPGGQWHREVPYALW